MAVRADDSEGEVDGADEVREMGGLHAGDVPSLPRIIILIIDRVALGDVVAR